MATLEEIDTSIKKIRRIIIAHGFYASIHFEYMIFGHNTDDVLDKSAFDLRINAHEKISSYLRDQWQQIKHFSFYPEQADDVIAQAIHWAESLPYRDPAQDRTTPRSSPGSDDIVE